MTGKEGIQDGIVDLATPLDALSSPIARDKINGKRAFPEAQAEVDAKANATELAERFAEQEPESSVKSTPSDSTYREETRSRHEASAADLATDAEALRQEKITKGVINKKGDKTWQMSRERKPDSVHLSRTNSQPLTITKIMATPGASKKTACLSGDTLSHLEKAKEILETAFPRIETRWLTHNQNKYQHTLECVISDVETIDIARKICELTGAKPFISKGL